ncbi:uncharacterized protein LOC130051535 [Ostrea edulis]|uniref:uncharacterized protein LOC130051535 n=1 Tax=Ostrea edulis TaxID=37623 RepID=UPI0024AF8E8E|nr:uncharacterized protein LOC130051535 [Ostrea edulis]
METSTTPRKTCVLSDVCILCRFSFVQIEKTIGGEEKVHKFYEMKLKLNSERLENIRKLTGLTDVDVTNIINAGVCKKCYRTVESVLKTESKHDLIKQKFREIALNAVKTNMLQLLSPRRKTITKRMLRSPSTSMPSAKKQPFDVSYVKLVKMAPFQDLTNTFIPTESKRTEVMLTLVCVVTSK